MTASPPLPRTIQVGPYTYRVVREWAVHNNGEDLAGEGAAYGTTTHQLLRITIRPDLPVEKERSTMLHEVLHALYELAHVGDGTSEEVVVGSIAPLLLDTLRRNKGLREYLLS